MNNHSANAVNSIGGTVSNGNLKIAVNGVESTDIPITSATPFNFNCKFGAANLEILPESMASISGVGYRRYDDNPNGFFINNILTSKFITAFLESDAQFNTMVEADKYYNIANLGSASIAVIPYIGENPFIETETGYVKIKNIAFSADSGLYYIRKNPSGLPITDVIINLSENKIKFKDRLDGSYSDAFNAKYIPQTYAEYSVEEPTW